MNKVELNDWFSYLEDTSDVGEQGNGAVTDNKFEPKLKARGAVNTTS